MIPGGQWVGPEVQGAGLEGPKGSRGRPTRSQGSRGRPARSKGSMGRGKMSLEVRGCQLGGGHWVPGGQLGV